MWVRVRVCVRERVRVGVRVTARAARVRVNGENKGGDAWRGSGLVYVEGLQVLKKMDQCVLRPVHRVRKTW